MGLKTNIFSEFGSSTYPNSSCLSAPKSSCTSALWISWFSYTLDLIRSMEKACFNCDIFVRYDLYNEQYAKHIYITDNIIICSHPKLLNWLRLSKYIQVFEYTHAHIKKYEYLTYMYIKYFHKVYVIHFLLKYKAVIQYKVFMYVLYKYFSGVSLLCTFLKFIAYCLIKKMSLF